MNDSILQTDHATSIEFATGDVRTLCIFPLADGVTFHLYERRNDGCPPLKFNLTREQADAVRVALARKSEVAR